MRRLQVSTLVLLALLCAMVLALGLYALRRTGQAAVPIGHQVNDLVATFEIPLKAEPGTLHTIPGWATLTALGTAAVFAMRALLHRARNSRS